MDDDKQLEIEDSDYVPIGNIDRSDSVVSRIAKEDSRSLNYGGDKNNSKELVLEEAVEQDIPFDEDDESEDYEFEEDVPVAEPEEMISDVRDLERTSFEEEDDDSEPEVRKSDLLTLEESNSTTILELDDLETVKKSYETAEPKSSQMPLEDDGVSQVYTSSLSYKVQFYDTTSSSPVSTHIVTINSNGSDINSIINALIDQDVSVSHPLLAADYVRKAEMRLKNQIIFNSMGLTRLAAVRFDRELRPLYMASAVESPNRWLFALSDESRTCLLIKIQ